MESMVGVALPVVLQDTGFFTRQLKKLDKAVNQKMRAILTPPLTVPGIGPVISTRITAVISPAPSQPSTADAP